MNGLVQRKWKEKVAQKREKVKEILERMEAEGGTKLALIQELIPLGLEAVKEELLKEIKLLV